MVSRSHRCQIRGELGPVSHLARCRPTVNPRVISACEIWITGVTFLQELKRIPVYSHEISLGFEIRDRENDSPWSENDRDMQFLNYSM